MPTINDFKVTDTSGNKVADVVGSTLSGTVEENKQVFDRLGQLIISKYNDMISYLATKGIDNGVGAQALTIYPVGAIYMSVNSTSPSALFGGTWERLKDRFLLCAGDTYGAGATGGSANAVVVSHTHTFSGTSGNSGAHTHTTSGTAASAGAHTHNTTGTAASAGAHTHGRGTMAVSLTSHSHNVYYETIKYASGTTSAKALASSGSHLDTGGALGGSYDVSGSTKSDGAHTHTTSGTAASAGAHTHTVSGTAASAGSHNHTYSGTTASTGSSGAGANMPPYLTVYVWKRTA